MLGYALILIAAVLWALIGVFTSTVLELGIGAMEIAFWRAVLGGAIFVVHALVTDSFKLDRRRDALVFGGFGLVGVTVFFAAYNMAIATGGISLAVILLYSAPAFVVILARLFLGEALTPLKLVALALVSGGVVLVSLSGSSTGVTVTKVSLAWGLAAGLSYASYYIVGKRLLTRYSPAAVYAFVLPVGALGLLPFVEFSPKTPTAWLFIALLAVLSTYLAYLAYYSGLRLVEASRAVLVASLEPVIAGVLAAAFFGERFGVWGVVGAALVLSASIITVLRRRPSH
jgi:drug/metabolite transporter (DMT)-like permease